MATSEQQRKFTKLIGNLINYAYQEGMELTFGEAFRTPEQQAVYLQQGKSKTAKSKHLERLAIDFNLFIDGEYKTDKESYTKLGKYWESLAPECVWGGAWGWDSNHFQYTK